MHEDWEVIHSTTVCPVEDYECTYCDKYGFCHLRQPWRDCDDYAAFVGEDS